MKISNKKLTKIINSMDFTSTKDKIQNHYNNSFKVTEIHDGKKFYLEFDINGYIKLIENNIKLIVSEVVYLNTWYKDKEITLNDSNIIHIQKEIVNKINTLI